MKKLEQTMKKSELRELIREVVRKTIREAQAGIITHKTPQKFVLLVRDAAAGDTMDAPLKMVFTSNNESDLDIPKGQLADIMQIELGDNISVNDFEVEGPMSYNEFKSNYKITIPAKLIYGI